MKKVALVFVNGQMICVRREPQEAFVHVQTDHGSVATQHGQSQWTSSSELHKSGSAEDNRWRACYQDLIGFHRVVTEGNEAGGGMRRELRAGGIESTEKSGMDGTAQQCTWPVRRIIF